MTFTDNAFTLKSDSFSQELSDIHDSESAEEYFIVSEGLSEQLRIDGLAPHLGARQAKVDTTQLPLSPTEQRLGTWKQTDFNYLKHTRNHINFIKIYWL